MKELFLPEALSIIAKNKGFVERCFAYHDLQDHDLHLTMYEETPGELQAPTYENFEASDRPHVALAPLYQQIISWFRDRGIRITELPDERNLWSLTIEERRHKLGHFPLDIAIEKAFKHYLFKKDSSS